MGSIPEPDNRAVFFFDIDVQNCLYAQSKNVHDHMAKLIHKYFTTHLNITTEEASRLHKQYYKDYGLAIEGLTRFHKIKAIEFNTEVDDALPLDELLSPDPETREILERFDKNKVKLWLFTNAHVTHGTRVVRLLGIADLFEGLTYCDYTQERLVPKPLPEMFEKAEREAGVISRTSMIVDGNENRVEGEKKQIYFVDDSYLNCTAAYARGWSNTVHLVEPQVSNPEVKAGKYQISHLRELLDLFPELLRSS